MFLGRSEVTRFPGLATLLHLILRHTGVTDERITIRANLAYDQPCRYFLYLPYVLEMELWAS